MKKTEWIQCNGVYTEINWIEFGGFFNEDQTVDWEYPIDPDTSEAEIAQFGVSAKELYKRTFSEVGVFDQWHKVRTWAQENTPEWKAYIEKEKELFARIDEFKAKTFVGQDLNKPGTLVELVDEKNEPWISLIGNDNQWLTGGDFFKSKQLRVLRYARLIDLDKIATYYEPFNPNESIPGV